MTMQRSRRRVMRQQMQPGLIPLAADSDSPSLKVNVADIEDRHFFASQPKPEQRLMSSFPNLDTAVSTASCHEDRSVTSRET